jgi:hypothetical protein
MGCLESFFHLTPPEQNRAGYRAAHGRRYREARAITRNITKPAPEAVARAP